MSEYNDLIKQTAEVHSLSVEESSFAVNYINHYYQNPDSGVLTAELITEFTRLIQSLLGLEASGTLDHQTIKAMTYTPRCGVQDYIKSSDEALAVKWNGNTLTYNIAAYVNGLSQTDQEDIIATAFNQWSEVSNISFNRVKSDTDANIIISTGRGGKDQFDGPGNTLAWAYLPPNNNYTGQLLMRFDLDETWIKTSDSRGIIMLNVACHEFGHLLGLDHSNNPNALMAPYYKTNITKPQAQDDIPRIQKLYGQPVVKPQPPKPTPSPGGKHVVEITVDNLSQIKIDGKPPLNFELF